MAAEILDGGDSGSTERRVVGKGLRVEERCPSPGPSSPRCRRGATTAESGTYPPAIPFPRIMMSGTTPYGSSADQVPVRPAPVSTSSATSKIWWRSQMARTRGQ